MRKMIEILVKDYKKVAGRLFSLISIIFTSAIYRYLNVYRGRVYHIPTVIDSMIPFNKYFVIPYLGWYIYLGFFLFYYSVVDEKKYFKILWGINAGMMICYIIYYAFPTYVPRPEIHGNDVFDYLMRFVYNRDNPYNCFPSIHVFDAVLFGIYINRDNNLNIFTKIVSSSTVILIIFSTFFVKQHYIYDAVSGIFIAWLIYILFNYKEVIVKLQEKQAVYKLENKIGE
ncbi:PAP2 superfamily protein [Caloramator quimbayensis]|uniref:PAP2 superfamily protein n=1 Tax=Caloramator quimbayensis TaxID=1147123 RepID=A0A1T4Y0I5_9CLOT|nr:phosphatase PAP2 family protein [Caloramator quimbayensis]SKA95312.1 PAP2 superfamily protein [Caloramator quimbayensis]